ncbi:unnamed protein product [Rotaria sordida]|uniref:Uncharacterized protein n=1 Tax=Rotaria sordida TaxID=392033 RepID=A0A818NE26_9BILA|nr:unnamed protein product [Rotaria sordida]CAF1451781.1 unnamed protein product [Rotaria sordida]CAF3603465.1 unnamed protein product [Rotaria sordida]CAF3744643.1 unnamed protein product [Rotaria sordida]
MMPNSTVTYTILNKDDIFSLNSSITKKFHEHVKKPEDEEAKKNLNIEMPITTIKIGSIIDEKPIKSTKIILTNAKTIEKDIKMHLKRVLTISSFNCLISVLIYTQTEAKLYKAFIVDANSAKIFYQRKKFSSFIMKT